MAVCVGGLRYCQYSQKKISLITLLSDIVVWNSEVRHPRCVGTITQKFCVLHFQSNTTIFHLLQWENTTTCFGPIGGPSSGCNLDLEISYKRCVWRGGVGLVISILGAMV